MSTKTASHPLDPLSLSEIEAAVAILRSAKQLDLLWRFCVVRLEEPPKAEVLAYKAGDPMRRVGFLLLVHAQSGVNAEALVDIGARALLGWKELPTDRAPYGQAPIVISEFMKAEAIVKADPAWRAAVMKRGVSEADLALVQVDPFSAGYFAKEDEKGQRCVRAVSYYRAEPRANGYAHPIDGVVAVVDLVNERIIHLIDTDEFVPVPKTTHNYYPEAYPNTRTDLKPLNVTQPDGPSFTVEGWKVSWQNWQFQLGFTPREGLTLNQLSYRDGERDRPIIYRASITEMVVPYADPSENHFWKSAFDAGEYGLGMLANSLALGCDCLGHIRYFDIPASDDKGEPFLMQNAVCLHEEDYGVLWKHYEFRNGVFEVRRSRRLVISFFATVGNYDYRFFWYLYQDGTIQFEAKLTGIILTTAIAPGQGYRWGGMVTPEIGGPTHQHFFNARLHMMVDGETNSVSEHEYVPQPWGRDNPYGNVFEATSRPLTRELDAVRDTDGRTGRFWKIFNPAVTNGVGGHPAYKLVANPAPMMLAQPNSFVGRRGGFAAKAFWVTAYDPAEKYASGDYPNQSAGDGLPVYVQQNRAIDATDIVVWHSFGQTHFCKPEDFPIMPVEYVGFHLKPTGFFHTNIAMDLPGQANAHSVKDGAAGDCCEA